MNTVMILTGLALLIYSMGRVIVNPTSDKGAAIYSDNHDNHCDGDC